MKSDDKKSDGEGKDVIGIDGVRSKQSLLVTSVQTRKDAQDDTEAEKRLKEEKEMLKQLTTKQALKSVKELANVKIKLN